MRFVPGYDEDFKNRSIAVLPTAIHVQGLFMATDLLCKDFGPHKV
jgi:hypothetical protein